MPTIYTELDDRAQNLVYLPRSVRLFRTMLQLATQGHHCAKVVMKNVLSLMKNKNQNELGSNSEGKPSVLNVNGLFSIGGAKELLFFC